MSEQLTRYFTAAYRYRRSERALVRSGARMDLEDLQNEVSNPRLRMQIGCLLNQPLRSTATN